MSAIVLGPDEGEAFGDGANRLRFLAQGPEHPLAVTEATIPPGFAGPVPHRHAAMADVFYVIEGVLTVTVDGVERELGAGGFALVPPGVIHAFANRSDAPVRFLNVFTPPGLEQYLKAVAARVASGSFPTPDEMRDLARPYDFHPVAPPT